MSKPLVSVVLGTYNRRKFLKTTLESVRNNGTNFLYEIIVVDGGSTDGSLKWLIRQKDVITIVQHNRDDFDQPSAQRSWGYFMNLGFKCAQGKYVLMISDDCLLVPGAIQKGVERFEQLLEEGKDVGALAFYWRNWPDQEKYRIGMTFGNKLYVNHGLYLQNALQAVDYIDDTAFMFYHADGDLCLRMADAGYSCYDAPDSYVEHYSHVNRKVRRTNFERQPSDWAEYSRRWGSLGKPDVPWLEKVYIDKNSTSEKYWKNQLKNLWIKDIILKFKKKWASVRVKLRFRA